MDNNESIQKNDYSKYTRISGLIIGILWALVAAASIILSAIVSFMGPLPFGAKSSFLSLHNLAFILVPTILAVVIIKTSTYSKKEPRIASLIFIIVSMCIFFLGLYLPQSQGSGIIDFLKSPKIFYIVTGLILFINGTIAYTYIANSKQK